MYRNRAHASRDERSLARDGAGTIDRTQSIEDGAPARSGCGQRIPHRLPRGPASADEQTAQLVILADKWQRERRRLCSWQNDRQRVGDEAGVASVGRDVTLWSRLHGCSEPPECPCLCVDTVDGRREQGWN